MWQLANGGPPYDPDNAAASHRACNRNRATTIDDIAIATAASYGVTLIPNPTRSDPIRHDATCAPDGQHCPDCNGIHNPAPPGVTFVTSRNWTATSDTDTAPATPNRMDHAW
jgi:hypothetical protein